MTGESTIGESTPERPVRELLALALDLDDLDEARELARRLKPWFAVAKVGLELYASAGPDAVRALAGDGFEVFLDLKLHDIPATVGRSARVLGRLGPRYVTLHASGGVAMLAAGVEGLALGASDVGLAPATALAVTVLTSDPVAPPDVLAGRARDAARAGCGGVVCAAPDLRLVLDAAPAMLAVVPGTRLAGAGAHDQARVATPAEALGAGAGLLVVGRPVTRSASPEEAAAEIVASLERPGPSN
ncbi:MAG: putative orotidine 5-phosphate decarboxylase [Acidimicrobiaceae bacterium]|nr:putative orotidine 5-phosphate decarboxylase [Acidimicrobiaceae bacterium]